MFDHLIDSIYRRILSPDSLYESRRTTQSNELKRSLENALSTSERYYAAFRSSKKLKSDDEMMSMDSFIHDVIIDEKTYNNNHHDKSSSIVGMKLKEGTEEVMVLLAVKSGDDEAETYETIVEYPLVEFGYKLADAFENKLTSTTHCFVVDASSGLGSEIVARIAALDSSGLALIKEPTWMSMIANLSSQKLLSPSDLQKILFGLCRLNAWEIRNVVGENRTVVFTLPGQSCTAELLPSLQKAFPCERHVFIYDGCIDSTARGLRLLKSSTSISSSSPFCMSKKISATTPMTQLKSVPKIAELLSPFSYNQASIIEAWFTSVDTFLQLKHNEKKSGYTPFVCRLGFLLSQFGRLGNGSVDQSQLALTNLLQYITGSNNKSRPLKSCVLEDARKILDDIRDADTKEAALYKGLMSEGDKEAVEACAFAHKGILIENKTLMDTVQPQVEWSLKAAKRLTSCACCMPGQGDEEDEDYDDEEKVGDGGMEKIAEKKVTPFSHAPVYVDGKAMFAFDPTRFS